MKGLVKCSVVSLVLLLLGGAAIAQQNDLGGEGKTPATQQTTRSINLLNALPDGDQPLIAERTSGRLAEDVVTDELLQRVPQGPGFYTPIWEGLDQLSISDKQNALIQLEVPRDLQTALLSQVQEIEQLWNSGEFDQAVALLRGLEESQGVRGIAVGISWKVPVATSGPKWGIDVQIGARSSVWEPCLDFHDASGNLFAVLRRAGDDPRFAVNISFDGGQTWQETFTWSGGLDMIDLDAAVVTDYLYVIYVYGDTPDQARSRRFFTNNGAADEVYFWYQVFDKDVNVSDIAVTSSADQSDNRVYCLAILADNSLIYYWALAQGDAWAEIATGISNAARGLDACWNQDYAEWGIWVSFVATDNQLHVARRSTDAWEDIVLDTGARDVTSVGAFQDRILVAYECTGYDIKYRVSYNEGDNWYWGYVAYSSSEPPNFHEPHVTGRKGGGFAVVYEHEVGGEPDTCWFRHRDYGTASGTALFSVPQSFNEVDVVTGTPMTVEWIPPVEPACHAHGSIWIAGGAMNAYFDQNQIDRLPGDTNGDGIVDLGDAILVLNYLFRNEPAPDPLWTGDANCDGVVEIGDAIYLLNYLFREGDPPCC